MSFQGKYWVFTINNPTIEQLPPNVWPDVQYVIWQHEKGEEGTEHIQGYVCFTKVKRLKWLKSTCVYEAHWLPRLGSHSQAKHYCMKPVVGCTCTHCVLSVGQRLDGPWEHGTDDKIANTQGQRNDLRECKEMIDRGATELEVAEEHFGSWVRCHKAFERYRKLKHGSARDWITHVTVYWGPPGIGKSQRVRHEAGPHAYWLPQPDNSTVWWDGYDGQEVVVIDEFYGWIKRIMMQRLCDSTPIMVQNKGGSTPFVAKRIYITSNEPPSQWWKHIGLGPMERRLQGEHGTVIHMTSNWVRPEDQAAPAEEEHVPAIPEPLSPEVDLMDHYAWHGTPPPEVIDIDPDDDIHAQPPLQRCPECMRMVYLAGICETCEEFLECGRINGIRFQQVNYDDDSF